MNVPRAIPNGVDRSISPLALIARLATRVTTGHLHREEILKPGRAGTMNWRVIHNAGSEVEAIHENPSNTPLNNFRLADNVRRHGVVRSFLATIGASY